MEFSATDDNLTINLEAALSGLVKLTKALKFYPADHPTLVAAAEETCEAFQPLLARHDTRPYHITKDGFSLDAVPLAPGSNSLKELAKKLVERRVRHLLFLPELANHELLIFAEELSRPAAELHKAGGLPDQLSSRGIKSIWINETDLEKILGNLQKLEEQFEVPTETAEMEAAEQELPQSLKEEMSVIDRMRDLLELLKDPLDDEQYQQIVNRATQFAPEFFNKTGIAGPLALFNLLAAHRQDSNRSNAQRETATTTINQLLNKEIIQLLVNAVAEQQLKDSQRRALARLLVGLEMKVAPALLNRLFAERDALVRRHYSRILAHMGKVLFSLLDKALGDPQWHTVRNAVTVLGETRLEEALPLLEKPLYHPEVRVRRAVIRALSAIGGSSAIPFLVQLSQDESQELHQPAITALGALGSPEVIVPLNDILKKPDLLGKQTNLKLEIIKAMAATRSPQAIIPLLKLARRRNLLRRKSLERLRAEAILALGHLGNKHLLPILDRLPKSDQGPVNRALKQAKALVMKGE